MNRKDLDQLILGRDQRFAYTTNPASNSISRYSVDRDGTIALVSSVAATTSAGPQDMALSGDGRFLLAVSRASGAIDAFRVGYDGSLTAIGTTTGLHAGSVFGLAGN
ncbi:MAG: beta-propeller fold lactonase family protein [Chloroflexi bacterium]|nr:beta-propeller fold lactonase family protein [Chloroflexota bacterium]